MNPQAAELNTIIKNSSKTVDFFLSKKGKAIFFPKKGILSQSADAKAKKINATIGIALEDDNSPMRLNSIAKEINIAPEAVFPYAPSQGRQDLREKWKTMLFEKNPSLKGKEISLPVVTSALTHGLSMTGYLFVDEGDNIILPNLFWENYELAFSNAFGAKMNFFDFFSGNKLNVEGIEKKLKETKGKKILLLNFPNNPTGYTPTVNEVKELVSVIKAIAEKGEKILVIVDDAYFGLIYEEGIEKESIFSYLADLHENVLAVKLDAPTKEDFVWGFRIGFITFGIKNSSKELYSALESKTAGAIRGGISNSSNLSQSLLLKAYQSPDYNLEKQEKFFLLKERFEEVKKIFSENKKFQEFFTALPFNSGYFLCIELKSLDAEKVRQKLLEKYNTGVIAQGRILRIAFSAVKKDLLAELFENIFNACWDLRGNQNAG